MKSGILLRMLISLAFIVLLSACGREDLGLEIERVEWMTQDHVRFLEEAIKAEYKPEEIELVKICEAQQKDVQYNNGFEGEYLVDWQTADGKYEGQLSLEDGVKGYEFYSTGLEWLEPIEDRCYIHDGKGEKEE